MSHDRMLDAYMQMQNRFAGMRPSCEVRNAIAQTIKLFTIAIKSPIHDFRASSKVARIVKRQER